MTSALTKSYVNTEDPEHPVQDNLVMYQTFEKAKNDGFVGKIVNLQTGKTATTLEILDKVL